MVIKTKHLENLLSTLEKTPKLPVLYNNINKNTIAYNQISVISSLWR